MPENATDLRLSEPDIALIGKLAVAENLSLAMVTTIAALNLIGWLAPAASAVFKGGWRPMAPEAALASLLSAASLYLSRPRFARRFSPLGMVLAILMATSAAAVFAAHLSSLPRLVPAWVNRGMTPQTAGCFVLTGIAVLFIQARRSIAGFAADLMAFCLFFAVAVLVSGHIIGRLQFFGQTARFVTSAQTLFCLLLLGVVVFIRRAEYGVFSILLGRRIGSKVARWLTPVIILLPYFRELMRAHILGAHRMPSHYMTALLATCAVAVSLSLLLYLAWRLNALETEIQGLSLRDPLTGLYNLRGFRLLAEQSLLLAHRSGEPFSVLFIDVDDLKQVNDALGHQTGSDMLAATADLLREVFRETDVLGRIGGDEFAVAGQFSSFGMVEAAQRLRQSSILYNADSSHYALKFSAGSVTCGPEKREPLADLLAKADEEMYREKRRKKASAPGRAKLSSEPERALATPQTGTDPGA